MPRPATSQALSLLSDWSLFSIAGLIIGGITAALIVYCMVRFRTKSDDEGREPKQFRENVPLEIAWTLIPLLIVLGLFAHTYQVEAGVEHLDPNPVDHVHVDAFQWGWTFTYANGRRITGDTSHPPEFVLERGAPTEIAITSLDVTHSFWIPDFLFKRDAIPGMTSKFDLTPQRTGEFYGRCAQFCGLQHTKMTFRVRVVDAPAYRRWLSKG